VATPTSKPARPSGEGVPAAVSRRTIERDFTVRIPESLAKGDHRILLSDAETVNRMQNMAGMMSQPLPGHPRNGFAAQPGALQQPAVRFAGGSQSDGIL
jgi:hypothetical protein